MIKYAIGIDYGTLSGRALLVDVSNGRQIATSIFEYPHGVMDTVLPSGLPLQAGWALQHPQDYIDVLTRTIPKLLKESGVDPDDVISVSVDFTTCTVIPIKKDGTPLCFLDEFKDEPHAYVKLWKHQSAEPEATALSNIARNRGEEWLRYYGGKVSSELMIPKIWEVLNDNEYVYHATDSFLEACDWIGWLLTGRIARSSSLLALKSFWNKNTGFPSKDFFRALDPRLENVTEKLSEEILPMCAVLGNITEKTSQLTGLSTNTLVVVGTGDAHAAVPAVKVSRPGQTCAILGTSAVYITISKNIEDVPGVFSIAEDSIVPGCIGYEMGQSCVGDLFSWFIKNCVPQSYTDAAAHEGKDIYAYLNEKASALSPGECGLVALDWWNGNRSILSDSDLSGMILGMTLSTRPEEIYRALVESTAFGTKKILETLSESRIPTNELCATGGICHKSPFIMQCYANILNMPIRISKTGIGSALGAAIIASVIGSERGGYDTFGQAAEAMGDLDDITYLPNSDHAKMYEELYIEYITLHDYFGRGGNDAMKRLKAIRSSHFVSR